MHGGAFRVTATLVIGCAAALGSHGCSTVRFEDDDGGGGRDGAVAAQVGVTAAAVTSSIGSSVTGTVPGPREIEIGMIVPEGAAPDAMVVAVHHADGSVADAWWWSETPARVTVVDGDLVTFIARFGESFVHRQHVDSYRVTADVQRIERRFDLPAPSVPDCTRETMPFTLLFPTLSGASFAQVKTSAGGSGTQTDFPGAFSLDLVACAGTPSFDVLIDVMDDSGPLTTRLLRGVVFQPGVPVAIDLTFPAPSYRLIRFDIDAPGDALSSGCAAGWRSGDVGSDPLAQELHSQYAHGSVEAADAHRCEVWPYDFGAGTYDRLATVELPESGIACLRSASYESRGGPGEPVHFSATDLAEIMPDASPATVLVVGPGELGDVVFLEHHVGPTAWTLVEDPHQLAWPPVIPAFPAFLPPGFAPNGTAGGARVLHEEIDSVSGYAANLADAAIPAGAAVRGRHVITDCEP